MDPNKIDNELKQIWNKTSQKATLEEKEACWKKFNKEVFKNSKPTFTPYYKYAIAASFLVLIGLAALYPYFNSNTAPPFQLEKVTIIQNPTPHIKLVYLPDSTLVELESNAEVSYTKNFLNKREVTLTGEAFFKVTKDKKHPFKVFYKQTTTTVLGTSFKISSNKNKQPKIDLYEGSIKMNVKGSTKSWIMAPGETFLIKNDEVNISAFSLFKEFKNAPLVELIHYIENAYNYKVEFQSAKNHKNVTLKVKKKESLEHLIQVLAKVYQLHYKIDHNQKRITFTTNTSLN